MKNPSDYQFLSTLEKKVWNWLAKNDIPFDTQQTMLAPARELGSAVVDFILPVSNIILRCMGSYWHSGLEAKARDEFSKERLLQMGYIVVDLWEENLQDDKIEKTMEMALRGEERFR